METFPSIFTVINTVWTLFLFLIVLFIVLIKLKLSNVCILNHFLKSIIIVFLLNLVFLLLTYNNARLFNFWLPPIYFNRCANSFTFSFTFTHWFNEVNAKKYFLTIIVSLLSVSIICNNLCKGKTVNIYNWVFSWKTILIINNNFISNRYKYLSPDSIIHVSISWHKTCEKSYYTVIQNLMYISISHWPQMIQNAPSIINSLNLSAKFHKIDEKKLQCELMLWLNSISIPIKP